MAYQVKLETAINLTKDFRTLHKKQVAFTHGAFDLFHAGHSLFLNKSKPKNGILVVGLEPDSNIRQYKSKLRPIIPLEQRMEMLMNHNAVDFVFAIDELDTVTDDYFKALYNVIKPSAITYGRNFAGKNMKDRVKTGGIKVREIPDKVSSTTKIISSILNRYNNVN